MEQEELKKWRESGKIAAKAMKFARSILKEGTPLLEVAEKTEKKIIELGGKPAFPVDLCCDAVTAHYSPVINDNAVAHGLVNIDMGVSVDGYLTDTASSVDLTPDGKYKKMIASGDEALKKAISIAKDGVEVCEIGRVIFETINKEGFIPIKNLYGHEIARWKIHAGLHIPSFDNNDRKILKKDMIVAIEPFPTTGVGIVVNEKECQIFELIEKKPVRDLNARKILDYIESEYKTIPFCARWLAPKFEKVTFYLAML
jgi:methionyl aminopeptidase